MLQPSHTELFTFVKPGLYGLDHGLDYIWTVSMLYSILQKIAPLIMIIHVHTHIHVHTYPTSGNCIWSI